MRVRLKHRRLAEAMARRPISHNRWAQVLGLSSGHLSDLLSGRRRFPAAETRQKLLEGLDLPFEELFEIHQPAAGEARQPAEPARFVDASRDRPVESPGRSPGDHPMSTPFSLSTLFHDLRYAYALTVHKSQGSSFEQVYVDVRNIGVNRSALERNKLCYVALTRAQKRVFILQ